MAAMTFDTLKFVEKLKSAGVPDAQAKAEAEALQGVRRNPGISTCHRKRLGTIGTLI